MEQRAHLPFGEFFVWFWGNFIDHGGGSEGRMATGSGTVTSQSPPQFFNASPFMQDPHQRQADRIALVLPSILHR